MSRLVRGILFASIAVLVMFLVLASASNLGPNNTSEMAAQLWSLLTGFAAAYYDFFERVGKVLAPFIAVVSGGYAIYQKWHFAGRNLHLRLQEFLQREERRLRLADQELDESADRPGPPRAFQSPIFAYAKLGAALQKMAWGTPTLATLLWSRVRRAEHEIEQASDELQEQLDLWESKKKDYQRRLIQAHLVKGALAASRAAVIKKRGGDDRQPNHDALTEFTRAMGIDPNEPNLLALELAAHQRVRLGDFTGANEDFGRLAELAAQKPIVRARALKFQAEIHEFRNGSQPNINAATQLLNNAIENFPTPVGRRDVVELAELHEVQGRIRSKRPNWDWDDAALTSFTNAEGLYLQINGPDAEAGLVRIAEERRKILSRRSPQANGSGNVLN